MSSSSPIAPKQEHSLAKRFISKLLGNILAVIFSFIQHIIAPRLLGPAAYGNFSFIKNFFDNLFNFLDSGTSTAFFTKLSQNPQNNILKTFYWRLAACMLVAALVITCIVLISGFDSYIWPGYSSEIILLGLCLGSATWVSQITNKIIDAHALTFQGELWKALQRALTVLALMSLLVLGIESLKTFLLFQIASISILSIGWFILIGKYRQTIFGLKSSLSKTQNKAYSKDFWHYCSPLLVFAFAGFLSLSYDRWLLQVSSGSKEQGFYGLAFQVAALCFLFSSSISPLFMRDFSKKFAEQSKDECRSLLSKTLFFFYTITAYFSAFTLINASFVTKIVGGEIFLQAAPAIAIMALYPLHQTYGQICGNVFYATHKTRLYRNISLVSIGFGMCFSTYLIAPKSFYCLQLGAQGLAIKMILFQFLTANALLFFICKDFNLRLLGFLSHQLTTFSIFVALAVFLKPYFNGNTLTQFLLNGITYTIFSALIIYAFPTIAKTTRKEILNKLGLRK